MLKDNVKVKGIFLLPNLLTSMSLFAGFFAIISSIHNDFLSAVYAIFFAAVVDALDGRVARLTNTSTDFGKEFDNLADMVSFGISPALVIYNWNLLNFGKLGWSVCFMYVAAVALRLAKFASQAQEKKFFKGIPSPAGACALLSVIWLIISYNITSIYIPFLSMFLTLIISFLMVSNIYYPSFKNIDLITKQISLLHAFFLVLILFFVVMCPAIFFCILFMSYLLSGILLSVPFFRKKKFIFNTIISYLRKKNSD